MKKNTSNKVARKQYIKDRNCIKLFAICCVLFLFSCKAKKVLVAKKVVVVDTVAKAVDTKALKLAAIRASQTVFNTYSGKARTKLGINGDSNDVTLNVRIQRDQKIWVSITAIAGIEVARALITPDSLFLLNRLQNQYLKKPFSFINKAAGDQVNYKTLESLLIGNAIPELVNENADLQTTNGITTLSGTLTDVIYKVILGADLKVTQTNLDNQTAGQSLQVVNNAFVLSGNKVTPSQIDISSVVKDKKILVNLHYVKQDFDLPLEYPFSIPARYKPMQ
jgi:hypothetical protein